MIPRTDVSYGAAGQPSYPPRKAHRSMRVTPASSCGRTASLTIPAGFLQGHLQRAVLPSVSGMSLDIAIDIGSSKGACSMSTKHFKDATFDREYWVDSKALFKGPIGVDVEFLSAGAFDWVFADSSGAEVKTVRHANPHGGWTSIDFGSLGLDGDYSFGFRNASAGQRQIKQIDVRLR